jgi:NodT family efflux transporter outer membrane factor (OMF) lipoprotein
MKDRPARLLPVALALALLAAACTVGPDFKPPAAPEEKAFVQDVPPQPPAPGKDEVAQHFALGKKLADDWWTLFHSGKLTQVLEKAVAGNRTVVAAQASLAQAHEAVKQAAGAYYPQVILGAGAERQRINFTALGIKGIPPVVFNTFSVVPTVSYDLDPFGGNTRRVEQQIALALAQEYQLDATYLTLTGNVVAQAIGIASLRAQLAALEDIIASDAENLSLVQRVFAAGEATQLDVESATSQLAADRTLLPPLRQQLSTARHALSVLAGAGPGDWTPPDFDMAELTLPAELPLSFPSELAHRRPDILTAEAQLHALTAAIGVATAQLYPDVTLSATFGFNTGSGQPLFVPASNVWSLASQLTAPIFEGGRLEAQERAAERAFDASYATYQQTVLTSFGQIADLLTALTHDAELLAEQRQALQAAEASLTLTRTTYTVGNVSLLQVLDAQRLYEQARLGFVRADAQRYLDTAQLFVALGGGWEEWRKRETTTAAAPAQ